MRKLNLCAVGLGVWLCLVGCARHYESTAVAAWPLMAEGDVGSALSLYEKNVTATNDALLRLMDEAMLLRTAGRFEESNSKFLQAAEIIDDAGYISVSEQAITLMSNERQQFYQGEDFEKVLIHAYLALNFMALEQWESALVEARRVNEILVTMISDGKRPYKQNAFARYLMGMIYESEREWNDAFIAYRNCLQHEPTLAKSFPQIGVDVMRMALRLDFVDEFERFEKHFGKAAAQKARESLAEGKASLVLVYENGKSPEKYSTRERRKKENRDGSFVDVVLPLPRYKTRPYFLKRARLVSTSANKAETAVFESVEETAQRHLQDRMGRIVAKALATAATKAGIAAGVGLATDSDELGALAALLLFATSEADTRSWLLLPASFQVARLWLEPGSHEIEIEYEDVTGRVRESEILTLELRPHELQILQRRQFQ